MNKLKEEEKKNGIVQIYLFIILSFIMFLNQSYSYAGATYEKLTEINCSNTIVQVSTRCLDNDQGSFPFCVKQELVFNNVTDAKTIRQPASGILVKNNYRSIDALDALISKIACVKGREKSYLLIQYYNGGNCDECEWNEIFDLAGNKLSTSKKVKGLNNDDIVFEKTYEELGLPKPWPRSSFINVNLLKNIRRR